MIQGGTLEVRVVAVLILEEEATAAAVVAAVAAVQYIAQGIFNTGFIF
jgi:exoribonuclease II